MSNQYQLEDNVPDTTEVALANFQAQQSSLAAVNQFAEEAYNEVYQQLGALYTDADARGDENGKAQLEAARQKVEMLKQALQMNVANEISVLEAATHLGKKTQSIEKELAELTGAIYEYDIRHPLISSLAETIEQETYEYLAEMDNENHQDMLYEAISEAWDEIQGQIKRLFPQSQWTRIHAFVAALDGQEPLNDIQRGLFLSLLETFAADDVAAAS